MARVPSDTITLRGPLFEKKIDKVVQDAIIGEAMLKFEKRIKEPSRKAQKRRGFRKNPLRTVELKGRGGGLASSSVSLVIASPTGNFPRMSGSSWTRKNIAAVKAMRGRVLRSVAKKIVAELS